MGVVVQQRLVRSSIQLECRDVKVYVIIIRIEPDVRRISQLAVYCWIILQCDVDSVVAAHRSHVHIQ